MGFLNKLFGIDNQETENPEAKRLKDFAILKDDGVRAKNMGEIPYAEKCFTEALKLNQEIETESYLAEVLVRQDKHAEALPLLKHIVESEPNNLNVILLTAQTASELKDWQTMSEMCQKGEAINASEAHLLYMEAKLAEGQNDLFTAIAKVTQAIAKDDNYLNAIELRAHILMNMGQGSEAVKDTERLIELDCENEEFLLLDGDAKLLAGQTDDAEKAYQKVTELNPFTTEAPLRIIKLYAATNQLDKALHLADSFIKEQPEIAEAYKLRGSIRLTLKDEVGATADMKKSLELQPEQSNQIDGEFSNIENQMQERYKSMNPYGF